VSNSRSSVFCTVSTAEYETQFSATSPHFVPALVGYVHFLPAEFTAISATNCPPLPCDTGRNLPPSVSDPVLGHEPIFSPRHRVLPTFSTGRNLPPCVSDPSFRPPFPDPLHHHFGTAQYLMYPFFGQGLKHLQSERSIFTLPSLLWLLRNTSHHPDFTPSAKIQSVMITGRNQPIWETA